MPEDTTSIVLGNEYDEILWERITKYLANEGITTDKNLCNFAGSQEYYCFSFTIWGSFTKIERETYLGITISGDKEVVTKIAKAVQ